VLGTSTRPRDVFELIQRHRVTHIHLVPALLIRWIDDPSITEYDLSSLRVIQSGGQRLQPEVRLRAERALPGCFIQENFGTLFETIAGLRVPVMVDVGTTGMGAGLPGGLGARLEHARPLALDNLAARFPALTIIAAHPGWPWTDEMTAVALHKGNVYWELSGWAPKYFPPSLRTDIRGRLREKIMFGSDHPSLPYERILREWDELGYDQSVMDLVFHANAERVLGL
jgi:predicted TIM-barrel fold metal-dependent hydrolase